MKLATAKNPGTLDPSLCLPSEFQNEGEGVATTEIIRAWSGVSGAAPGSGSPSPPNLRRAAAVKMRVASLSRGRVAHEAPPGK